MSKVIRISENTYQRLQNIATPFDDTPDTTILKLLDFYENKDHSTDERHSETMKSGVIILNPTNPSDLTHTKVLEGIFDDTSVRNWRDLVNEAHKRALNELGSFEELKKISISNIYKGDKRENGYKLIEGTNVSIQGANANQSWASALKIAKRLNLFIEMKFMWRDKKGAIHPNQPGLLKWAP